LSAPAPNGQPAGLAGQVQALVAVPLNQHLGLVFDHHDAQGVAHAHFDPHPGLLAYGRLHGGALYALLDAMGLLALQPRLRPGQHAVTHDLHVSMLRAAPPGTRVQLRAEAVKVGRTLAFIDARAEAGGQVLATARITKSLVDG